MTPIITQEQAETAYLNGYVIDLGQITPEQRRRFDREVKQGLRLKVRAIWPNLTHGISPFKTVWIKLTGE